MQSLHNSKHEDMGDRLNRTAIRRLSPPQDFRTTLIQDVRAGLSGKPYWFPCKYRYDEEGSRLCEQIVHTKEYYLYRDETNLLRECAKEILELVAPDEVVELGSGFSTKTRILIEAMQHTKCHLYIPFDISEDALSEGAEAITDEYKWLEVYGQLGDYDTDLPKIERRGRRLLVFLGSSFANLDSKSERSKFLENIAAVMVKGDALLLGLGLLKEIPVLLGAYKDSQGLNGRFNIRTLDVINCELDGNFPLKDFKFNVSWDTDRSVVLSKVEAKCDMKISISAIPLEAKLAKGDEIILGMSHKFSRSQLMKELAAAGLQVTAWYTDSAEKFGLILVTLV